MQLRFFFFHSFFFQIFLLLVIRKKKKKKKINSTQELQDMMNDDIKLERFQHTLERFKDTENVINDLREENEKIARKFIFFFSSFFSFLSFSSLS